jgi:hypothetical protein
MEDNMKYHLLPIENPRNRNKIVTDQKVSQVAKDLLKDVNTVITKTNKKNHKSCCTEPFFLYDQASMAKLFERMEDGDEIILHGEGQPFLIGLDVPCPAYDLNAYKFASLLHDHQMPDLKMSIALLACNSGLTYERVNEGMSLNFTRDLSKALHVLYGYQKVSVIGYTGFIVDKEKAGKYSVSAGLDNDKGKRSEHASLEDASVVYEHGVLVKEGRTLGNLSNVAYSWAQSYIESAHEGNVLVKVEEQKKFKEIQAEQRSEDDKDLSSGVRRFSE